MYGLRMRLARASPSLLYRQRQPACQAGFQFDRSQRLFASEPASKFTSATAQLGARIRTAASAHEQLTATAKNTWNSVTSHQLVKEWTPTVVAYCLLGAFVAPFLAAVGLEYIRGPQAFTRRVDRSSTKFPEPFPEAQHEFVSANGLRLHVVTSSLNTGTQPLVLFLHGFPECWYSWRHQLAALQGSFDVAAIDMRGYNLSDKPQDVKEYRVPTLAADVPAVVKALGREKCILVGHDWGAAVAWTAASLHAEVVDRVVCLAGPPLQTYWNNFRGQQILLSSYLFAYQLPHIPEAFLAADDYAALDDVFSSPGKGGPIREGAISALDIEQYKTACAQPGALTAALNYYRAWFRMLVHERSDPVVKQLLTQPVTVPSMMLFGEKDMFLGAGLLEGLQEHALGVRLHILSNCSHFIQQDQPEEVNRLLKAFFEEKLPAPAAAPAQASA